MLFVIIIIGLIVGLLASFFGIGVGLLISPILFILFSESGVTSPVIWAIGTSLFCSFISALISLFSQKKRIFLFLKQGLIVGLFGVLGVYFGKEIVLSEFYTKDVYVPLFFLLLLFVSVLFFRKNNSDITLQITSKSLSTLKMGGVGAFGGLVASLTGIGGGVVLIPIMNLFYRLPTAKTVRVSSIAIVLISLSGWVQFAFFTDLSLKFQEFTIGYVDFSMAIPLIVGAYIGSLFSSKLKEIIPSNYVQPGFTGLLVLLAILLIWNLL